jgi:hypothetical protein
MTHRIKLQSSFGDFSHEFRERLPAVEAAMEQAGLDPSDFVIARDAARTPRLPIAFRPTGNPVEYTVFVKGQSFSVVHPSDTDFLQYFYDLCVACAGDHTRLPSGAQHRPAKRPHGLLARIGRWLNKPI